MPKIGKPRRHGKKWQFNYIDSHGKRRWETQDSCKAAQKAQHKRQAEAQAVRSGEAVPVDLTRMFPELAELWEEVKHGRKRTLKDDLIRTRLHLLPALEDKRLVEINARLIASLQRDLSQKMSTGTVRNVLTLLRAMLNLAVDQNWLVRAPRIRLPVQQEKPYKWIKTPEELGRLMLAARRNGYPGLEAFYSTAVYTGMRAGELCGLQRSDIDFGKRLITVQRSFNGPTKTNVLRRIPIGDALMPVLSGWCEVRLHHQLVFANRRGNMHSPGAAVTKQIFHACLELAEIERMRFHDLRHTFASHWMLGGGSIYRLRDHMGHKNITTTQRYAHLDPAAFSEDWGRLKAPVYSSPERANVIAFPTTLKHA
jgi:integrase